MIKSTFKPSTTELLWCSSKPRNSRALIPLSTAVTLQEEVRSNLSITFRSIRLSSTANTWASDWDSDGQKSISDSDFDFHRRLGTTPFLAICTTWLVVSIPSCSQIQLSTNQSFLLVPLYYLQRGWEFRNEGEVDRGAKIVKLWKWAELYTPKQVWLSLSSDAWTIARIFLFLPH